jgi:hypothetical protein
LSGGPFAGVCRSREHLKDKCETLQKLTGDALPTYTLRHQEMKGGDKGKEKEKVIEPDKEVATEAPERGRQTHVQEG